MKTIFVCAAVVAAALLAGMPDVTGQWLVVLTFDRPTGGTRVQQRVDLVCTFEQHDATLSGSCRPADAPEGLAITGTADAKSVVWSFQIAPNSTAAKQSATFRGTRGSGASAMNGTFEFGESHGRFRAKKRGVRARRLAGDSRGNTSQARRPSARAASNVAAIACFAAVWWLRYNAETTVATTGVFGFEIVALLLGATGGWLGGELVDRLGVGVEQRREPERAELNLRPVCEGGLAGAYGDQRCVAAVAIRHRTLA
jgi:hypothetical protein